MPRASFWPLDHEDVIAHVDGDRSVVTADIEDAFADGIDRRSCSALAGRPRQGEPPPRPPALQVLEHRLRAAWSTPARRWRRRRQQLRREGPGWALAS